MQKSVEEVFENTFYQGISKLVVFLFGFVFNLVLIRIISVETYGIISLYSSILSFLIVFAGFGLYHSAVYFFSSKKEGGEVLGTLLAVYATISILVSILILFFGEPLLDIFKVFRYNFTIFFIISVFVINSVSMLLTSIFKSFKMKCIIWISFFSSTTTFLVIVSYQVFQNLTSILAAQIVTGLMSLVFSLAMVRKSWFGKLRLSGRMLKEMISYSFPIYLAEVFWFLGSNTSNFFLNYFLDLKQISFFSAAYGIYRILDYATESLKTGLFPVMSKVGKDERKTILVESSRIYGTIFTPFVITIFALSGYIVPAIYSIKYTQAASVLQILCFLAIIRIISTPMPPFSYSSGRQNMGIYVNFAAFVFGFLFNLWLIPSMGANGAALSAMLISAITTLLWYISLHRSDKIQFDKRLLDGISISILLGLPLYMLMSNALLVYPLIFLPLCFAIFYKTGIIESSELKTILLIGKKTIGNSFRKD